MGIYKKKLLCMFTMLLVGALYFFCIGEKGVILERDSYVYIEYFSRKTAAMPLYPYWLDIIHFILGDKYIELIYIPQGILAICVSIVFSIYVCKRFNIDIIHSIVIYIASLLPYGYTLMEYVVTHSVMTECISIPLFYIFTICLIEVFNKISVKWIIICMTLSFLLILTRMQMLFTMVSILLVIYKNIIEKYEDKCSKGIFSLLKLIPIVSCVGFVIVLFGYIAILDGRSDSNQLCNSLLGKALTIMESKDIEYYQEDEIDMFNSIYTEVRDEQRLFEDTRKNLLIWEDVVNYNNENMKLAFENIYYSAKRYLNGGSSNEVELQMFKYMNVLISREILHHPIKFLYEILLLIPSGLVSMVFIQKRNIYSICFIIGIVIWCVYVVFMHMTKCKKLKSDCRKLIYSLTWITVVNSIANVIFTNIVLFGIQRYMIYTMGLIYSCLYLMIYNYFSE